jgi:hypothetical protein
MDETQTFVGQGGGGAHAPSRLAMFAYTSPFCDSTHRLVVEFGNLTHDAAFFGAPDFPARVGQAAIAALARVFPDGVEDGETEENGGVTPVKFAKAKIPAFMLEARQENKPLPPLAKLGSVTMLLVAQRYRAMKETPVLNTSSRKTGKPVRAPIMAGEEFDVAYAFASHGEPWGLSVFGSRIPLGDAVPVPH